MATACTRPAGTTVDIVPISERSDLYKQVAEAIARALERGVGDPVLSLFTLYDEEPVQTILVIRGGRLAACCVDKAGEVLAGDRATGLLGRLLSSKVSGLLEVIAPEKGYKPDREWLLASPRRLEDLLGAQPPPPPRPAPGIDGMSGIEIGILLAEVIVNSQLVRSMRNALEALRTARLLSRREPGALYRLAVRMRDGSLYNVFIKGGRVRRVVHLSPSGIEGRVVGRDEPLRDILTREDVEGASIYKVNCPRCEKIIVGS